ncbi:MAG: hypothetical protein KKH52_01285 [Nanoarchaeota archaeon]|nr:hypothetical protein [Nanoarchaeota archaeon]MBU1622629.1 hypothetical protein [Nanoarchaeota archaeon]MBU1974010.1 hypothetical protein [Nanoarchaeota archaeon]
MQIEEILQRIRKGGKFVCSRCHEELGRDNWAKEWDEQSPEFYYKTFICNCGKKNWIKLDFLSSGHESVLENGETQIESSSRVVKGGID